MRTWLELTPRGGRDVAAAAPAPVSPSVMGLQCTVRVRAAVGPSLADGAHRSAGRLPDTNPALLVAGSDARAHLSAGHQRALHGAAARARPAHDLQLGGHHP